MQSGHVPMISVVMPAYNAEQYIREAIDSILSQTYCDFEFIIINDGSSDGTKDIINSYSDSRIVYIENEINSGICVTLNKGLDAARGKYIARMDSDDISMPNRLQVQFEYLENHPEIGVLGSDLIIFGDGVEPYVFRQLYTPEECTAGLLFNSCFAHPSVMLRTEILRSNNLKYKEEYRGLEDYELWWQIHKYSKLCNVPTTLLRYRQHACQVTQNVTQKVNNASNEFAKVRFHDLGIIMNGREIDLINGYSNGYYNQFDADKLWEFIALSKKILKNHSSENSSLKRALKLTLSKAITFILSNIESGRFFKQNTYNKALLKGIFPPMWYVKVTYYNLLK